MSSLVLLLILCLCLHACNARHIGVLDKENRRDSYLPSKAGVEKEKFHGTLIPSRFRSSTSEKLRVQETFIVENESKALRKEEDTMGVTSEVGRARNENFSASPSRKGLQQSMTTMGRERQARSMLAAPSDDTEETIDSKGNTAVEDIVVMDYAQPHRKPPIHNREP